MGGVTDQALMCNLVPVLTQKNFSLKWLTNNSVKFIQSILLTMGHKRNYVEMLQNVAERIHKDHNGRVLDKMFDLFTHPEVDFSAIRLAPHPAFNMVDVSPGQ